ncbi:mercuric reductase [Parvularcula bermudensis HTCC2503]|uniref:TVP38/TMEM64 family membrane protein n=1 Tax=Parvularcula bermudensis (strain ATCC BAA-594 / HTCC2503 / KCTC 12087) TaxID=314260 RepID=E0TGR2_PARBH|nr:TVP38/TMEM64 family protein [Parvularcula bermudensis]ADM10671.1 mercuric reductase [Parvularcula bermudensis HTCC2503]
MSQKPQAGEGKSLRGRLLLAIGGLGLLIALGYAAGIHNYLRLEALDDFAAWIDAHTFVATLTFVTIYAVLVAISFPGATLLTIAGGYLFGQWIGTIAVVIAATIGATVIFSLAKWVFKDSLAKQAGGALARMEKGFREDELNYMFLLRLVPAFPFVAINIGAGVLNVKLTNYLIGTFFGIIPGSFVYVSIGNAIQKGSATLQDAGLLSVFAQPQVYIPFIGLAVLGALPILIKRLGGGRAAKLADKATGGQ